MSLASRSFSAAGWTTASSFARAGFQLLQIVVMARFLTPQDFGLMAMVMVVLSYAALFSDMGLSTAFVQRQQISHEERSSLYWLSVAAGATLMLFVMAISPLAAMFFGEQQLMPMMILVSTNFLVIALGQQLRMDAEKSLNFKPLALIEIASTLLGLTVAIVVAWSGGGVYALVFAAMVSAWLMTILYWLVLAKGWCPAWRLRWDEVRWFVRFGGGMVLNNVINHINSTIDIVLGGRLLGAGSLGLYSVPRNLVLQAQSMINPVFTRVGFPLIASIQHDKPRVKSVYLTTVNLTATVNAPIYVALMVFAPEIVLFMLGSAWSEAAPLLRVLAVWGLLRSFGNPAGSLLFGLGYVKLAVKWNALLLLVIPTAAWVGSHWGAIGIAWSLAAVMGALFIPGWAVLVRPTCGAGLWEYGRPIIIPVVCAIIAGLSAYLSTMALEAPLARLIFGISVGLFVYGLSSWAFNRECVYMLKRLLANRTAKVL